MKSETKEVLALTIGLIATFLLGVSLGADWASDNTPSNTEDAIFSDGTLLEIHAGTGTPEGSRSAPVGSFYERDDGALGTTLYYNSGVTGAFARLYEELLRIDPS